MRHVHADISPNVAALTEHVARDLELQQATALWLPRYGVAQGSPVLIRSLCLLWYSGMSLSLRAPSLAAASHPRWSRFAASLA